MRHRYKATPSLICWAQTQNHPWIWTKSTTVVGVIQKILFLGRVVHLWSIFHSSFFPVTPINNSVLVHTKHGHQHYDDVRMGAIASQITSLAIVYSAFYSGVDQRKHQSSASLAFVWGIHRDRWIPRTKGQLRGKWFHLMTSSWSRRDWRPSSMIIYYQILMCYVRWRLTLQCRMVLGAATEIKCINYDQETDSQSSPKFGPILGVIFCDFTDKNQAFTIAKRQPCHCGWMFMTVFTTVPFP